MSNSDSLVEKKYFEFFPLNKLASKKIKKISLPTMNGAMRHLKNKKFKSIGSLSISRKIITYHGNM